MVAQPKVSIIIPTYNHASFLKEVLGSVLGQTYHNWEAIVVNNFSSDNTIDVVQAFDEKRIRLYNFKNEGVIAASRNFGISKSDGDIIAFLDSDDFWYPEKLFRCVEALRDKDVVCHSEEWIKENGETRVVHYGPLAKASYRALLFGRNCLSTSAMVVRRSSLEAVSGFSEKSDFITSEDYELWLRLAASGCRFGFVNEVLGEYRLHSGNQSRLVLRQVKAEWAVLQKHFSGITYWSFWDRLICVRRFSRVLFSGGYRYITK